MNEFNIEYTCDNLFVVIKSKHMAKCACGFYSETKDTHLLKECPSCNAKRYDNYLIGAGSRIDFLDYYKFTNEKGYMRFRHVDIIINKEDRIDFKQEVVEIIFETEVNKKGKSSYKPKIRIDYKDTEPLLKSRLAQVLSRTYGRNDFNEDFVVLNVFGHNYNFYEKIWGINHRYKYNQLSLSYGIYEPSFGYLDDIKNFDNFLSKMNKEDIRMIKRYIDFYFKSTNRNRVNGISSHCITSIFSYGDSTSLRKQTFKKLETKFKLLENKNALDVLQNSTLSNTIDICSELIVDHGFTLEDILNLIDIADRQSYNFSLYTYHKYVDMYEKCGIPIDKAPKELAIYMNKSRALEKYSTQYSRSVDNKDFALHYFGSIKVIKIIYEHYGFKGLDKMLFDAFMNNISIFKLKLMLDNEHYISPGLIVISINYNYKIKNIKAIIKENGEIIKDKDEIVKYVNSSIKKAKSKHDRANKQKAVKKEAISC